MSRKKSKASEQAPRSNLQLPRSDAEARIDAQIIKGEDLLQQQFANSAELKSAIDKYYIWDDYNKELLRRIVDTDELKNDYTPSIGVAFLGPSNFASDVRDHLSDVQIRIRRLQSIKTRLELIPESASIGNEDENLIERSVSDSLNVFIVHGHDEEAKQSVARCVEKLGLNAIILHEQPNKGLTIIEKFEEYADVAFAIILLTPDDQGAPLDKPDDLRHRARQNVILELGFFIGKLGRERVSALHKGDIEIPSDFSGVLWIEMDQSGAWQFAVAREMKAAGMNIDLNLLG